MNDRKDYLIRRLDKYKNRTRDFFSELTPDQWERQVYSEGASWQIRQILAHLASAEDNITRLVEHILSGGEGVPGDFDLDGYNERKVSELEALPPDELLEKFLENRERTIQMVSRFGEGDLDRKGRHPWLGVAPVEEIIKLMYRHTQIHQRDIRNTLNS